jgi:hypothetical protein
VALDDEREEPAQRPTAVVERRGRLPIVEQAVWVQKSRASIDFDPLPHNGGACSS